MDPSSFGDPPAWRGSVRHGRDGRERTSRLRRGRRDGPAAGPQTVLRVLPLGASQVREKRLLWQFSLLVHTVLQRS